jgi:chromate transporter
MNQLPTLASVFASLSLLAVGGGMAAYPQLKALVVDVKGWLTLPQLDYLYGVGQAAPGPNMMMIISIGTIIAGLPGAVVVFMAFFGPTALLTFVVGRLWSRLQGRPWIVAVQHGLLPVSIGLLLAGCLTFAKGALTDWVTMVTAAAVFTILLRTRINPAFLILAGGLVGIVAFGRGSLLSAVARAGASLAQTASAASTSTAGSFDFALIGDVPYSDDDVHRTFPNLAEDLNRYQTLRFVVHDGDIKPSAGLPCTAQLFADRRRLFKSIVAPMILAFGDNDWRDCGRPHDPPPAQLQDQRRALTWLRREFATGADDDGLGLRRHSRTFPEIVHWTMGGVRFVVLNVPGPDDNHRDGYEGEYRPRSAANLAEVTDAFEEAARPRRDQDVRALVIILQARPFVRSSLTDGSYTENPHLTGLLTTIKEGARNISPRPVVLVHGDSHVVTIDQPVKAQRNIARVSTFGTPFVHWIRITVDPRDPSVFAFHLQIVQKNLPR